MIGHFVWTILSILLVFSLLGVADHSGKINIKNLTSPTAALAALGGDNEGDSAAAAATTTTAQPYPTSTGTSAMSTATAGAATVPPQRSPPASSTDAFAKESVYNPELRVCSICLGMGTTVQSTQPSTDNTGVLKCRLCGVQAHAKCYGYTCGG